ncbi:GIY-YIG nuclease family protein [Cohnella faecalis]|uniref:GIY-YIG nuclease family protein n=1 Tax=Cohnella faecalis TaxID=2315694 RepID=UPI001314362A|nr:GIY-YIG nuclease family protein [Cohnella faecalis]
MYELYEVDKDGKEKVKYVGRTRQNINERLTQHEKSDPNKKGLETRIAEQDGKRLTGLTYSEGRGLESVVYEKRIKQEGKLLNRIKPIDLSELGKETKKGMKAAEYLKKLRNF